MYYVVALSPVLLYCLFLLLLSGKDLRFSEPCLGCVWHHSLVIIVTDSNSGPLDSKHEEDIYHYTKWVFY